MATEVVMTGVTEVFGNDDVRILERVKIDAVVT